MTGEAYLGAIFPAPRPRPCGATREPVQDAGWECTGVGLIVVMTMLKGTLPVVLPARALEIIDPEPWWDLPITGDDHLHLVVPRRPTDFKGDSRLIWGDAVFPAVKLGTTVEGESFSFTMPTWELGG